jgi:leucyl/phenylalanyl-tRNA--protein transferase
MATGSEIVLTPDLMLRAYAMGIFPMAESAGDNRLVWFDPDPRGVLPLDAAHFPRRLIRTVRSGRYRVTADEAFEETLDGCAESTDDRPSTWINGPIRRLCAKLHRMGYAHSVEVWEDGQLVGGLYGVALAGAFFGESMFSRARDASKVALVHLVARLRHCGFTLLDTQFVTSHLQQFGAIEIPRTHYRLMLTRALEVEACFHCPGAAEAVASLAQSTTQMS